MADQLHDEPPPFGRTWGRVYAAVLILLFVIILLLYWLTESFVEVQA
jgi:hypothetical protein